MTTVPLPEPPPLVGTGPNVADADDRNVYRRTERDAFVRLLLECDKVLSTLEGEDDTEAEMLEKLRASILRATAPHRADEADLLSVRADLPDPVARHLAADMADRWRDECLRLRPDAELCKRLIDEVVRRNGGSTPNWLIDMAPNVN